jgi:flagellar biosynthetic protein FliO
MDMPMDLMWDVAAKTALVLAILYGALWVLRRYYGKGMMPRRGAPLLVLQSAQLGPGRSVHLIGVGSKTLLVGATSQQVSLLADVGPMDLAVDQEETSPDSFERQLRKAVGVAGSLPLWLKRRPAGTGSEEASDRGDTE